MQENGLAGCLNLALSLKAVVSKLYNIPNFPIPCKFKRTLYLLQRILKNNQSNGLFTPLIIFIIKQMQN